ncbi:MAG: GNAT family N-acetyltransferase [Acutalibacter sp.]
MKITEFPRENREWIHQLICLLQECFPHSYSEDLARQQAALCMEEDRIALMAEEDGKLLGFVGAMPQYGDTAWELHPLAVTASRREEGIGRALVAQLEKECASRGCLTLYLGSDDEFQQTTLSQGDLFEDTFEKIQHIQNLRRHPYEFYQKQGFQIVGVLPDANGPGKPDIFLAKRVGRGT